MGGLGLVLCFRIGWGFLKQIVFWLIEEEGKKNVIF